MTSQMTSRTTSPVATSTDLDALNERFVAMWNEPDATSRRTMIRDLWARDGVQILADPPEASRAQAADLGFAPPSFEVHGHDAIEVRVARAHEMFVGTGEFRFQAAHPADELMPGVVVFRWEMVATADGSHAGGGLDVLDLDSDGRIRRDYQFIER
jgi:hypothetical protein